MSLMRLSTMWAVHGRLDAAGEPDEPGETARQIVARWEHGRDTLRLVRASANSVYCFDAEGGRRFLRFAADSERTRRLIEAEVDLLQWLVARGASVARPLPSAVGHLVETVATAAGIFHAVTFDRLEGKQLEFGDVDQGRFHSWGAALGRLHATMSHYAGPAIEARPSWRDHLAQARSYIPAGEPAIHHELDLITTALEALPATRMRCGLIHGDFELDNLRWPDVVQRVEGERSTAHRDSTPAAPGMLDFDDCSIHWYAADVAFALRDVFDAGTNAGTNLARAPVEAFVRGYRDQYPLDDELLAAVPLFSRLSRLLAYTTMNRSLDLPDSAGHPEWLRALRRKVETRVRTYAAALKGEH